MKKYIIGTIFAVLLACALSLPVYAVGIEAAIGGWQQSPSGDLGYKTQSSSDELNFEDDLDYETENRIMGRLKIDMPLVLPNVYLMAVPMDFEGTGSKTVDFKFGDQVFSADTIIDSKVTLNQYDLALFWGIPGIRTLSAGKFNIDLGLNARLIDFEAEISGESASVPGETINESQSLTLVVPMVYAAAQIMPIERFAIEAEARGITIAGNSLISLIGRLRYQFIGPAFIAGGYRTDTIDIDEDDVVVDASISGPFVELGIKF